MPTTLGSHPQLPPMKGSVFSSFSRPFQKIPGTRLTDLGFIGKVKRTFPGKRNRWVYNHVYLCDCGEIIVRDKTKVGDHPKKTKSCGCLLKEMKPPPGAVKHQYKKGHKPKTTQGAKGKSPHNKGKICIYEKNNQRYRGSKRRYITDQQLNEMHAGL